MKGNSGASLNFHGDYVIKECAQSAEQVEWFRQAEKVGLVEGFRLPQVDLIGENRYRVEYIAGYSATMLTSVSDFQNLVRLIEFWSTKQPTSNSSWDSYLERLKNHVTVSNSNLMEEAFGVVSQSILPQSFGHGDLTLENVLVSNDGQMVLIDPNYAPSLFQSWVLDIGKLLQSVHSDYHRVFNSSPGVDPSAHLEYLQRYLRGRGLWKLSLVSELSHIMRLRRYRRPEEYEKVDKILKSLINEIKNCPEDTWQK